MFSGVTRIIRGPGVYLTLNKHKIFKIGIVSMRQVSKEKGGSVVLVVNAEGTVVQVRTGSSGHFKGSGDKASFT